MCDILTESIGECGDIRLGNNYGGSGIYFLSQYGNTGMKVGRSNNVIERIRQLRRDMDFDFGVYLVIPIYNNQLLEYIIHQKLANFRINKAGSREIFKYRPARHIADVLKWGQIILQQKNDYEEEMIKFADSLEWKETNCHIGFRSTNTKINREMSDFYEENTRDGKLIVCKS